MFYRHRKTHQVLEAVSSLGLLILGFTVLLLWLFNMPLFIKMVVYVATLYYLFQIFNTLMELQSFDNFTFHIRQKVLFISFGIIELILLITNLFSKQKYKYLSSLSRRIYRNLLYNLSCE